MHLSVSNRAYDIHTHIREILVASASSCTSIEFGENISCNFSKLYTKPPICENIKVMHIVEIMKIHTTLLHSGFLSSLVDLVQSMTDDGALLDSEGAPIR